MTIPLLALAVLALPPQDWRPAPLPSLCAEGGVPHLRPLADGRHVRLEQSEPAALPTGAPGLSSAQLVAMLEGEARREGRPLEIYPTSPPLLLKGPPEDRAWADAVLGALDRAGRRAQVELSAWLVPVRAPAGGDALPPPADLPEGAQVWRARVRSGDEIAFGERERQCFVAGYDIEVASDSGVAAPVIGSAFTGRTLHVRAARVEAGARVHLCGELDLASLRALEDFDPDTPDLGTLQQPLVDAVQITFSGVVASGGFLRVALRGSALEQPDWTLWLRAETEPDPDEAPAAGWRVADLALLAGTARRLPAWDAGTGLEEPTHLASLPALARPISTAGLASLLAPERERASRSAGSPPSHWTDRLVFVPASEHQLWRDLRQLVAAMEAARTPTARVEIVHGELSVELPLAAGEPGRVLAGTERTLLVDYDAEIAPDTWMPVPRVELAFDGLAWHGRFDSGWLESSARVARTTAVQVRGRAGDRLQAQLGALQVARRGARAATASQESALEARTLLAPEAGSPALSLRFRAP